VRIEAELAGLEEVPVPIALYPATLDRHIKTVNALSETMAVHACAEDDNGSLIDDFRVLVQASSFTRTGHAGALRSRREEGWLRW
jgi:site-specific DNA recombinase